jgi:L-2-hydroxyglutarate oxidase LhgO
VVIGGGCVGLSVLRSLSLSTSLLPSPPPLFLLDASPSPGSGLTSRNSGVLHSGIYYPPSSNKERLCLRGRPLLSAFCAGRGVPLSFPGKTVVATSPGQLPYLRELLAKAEALEASALLPPGAVTNLPDAAAVRAAEPRVSALAGARFATTGVVDVPRFVDALALACAEAPAAEIAQSAEVVGGRRDEGGWLLDVRQGSAEYQLQASLVVNAAGLGAAELYGKVVQGPRPPRHFFCQGEWLRLPGREKIFNGLVCVSSPPRARACAGRPSTRASEAGMCDGVKACAAPSSRSRPIACPLSPQKSTFFSLAPCAPPPISPPHQPPSPPSLSPQLPHP